MVPCPVTHPGHPAAFAGHPEGGHAFDDGGTTGAGTAGERHGHTHRVGPTFIGHQEPADQIVGPQQGPQVGDLGRREFVALHPEPTDERLLAPQRLHPVDVGGDGDVSDGVEAGRQSGLVLEALVEVARVAAHEEGGLVDHSGRGDEPGGVPGGSRREHVPLQQDHVRPAQAGEVVGDARPDDPSAHDDHPGPPRDAGGRQRCHVGVSSCPDRLVPATLDVAQAES